MTIITLEQQYELRGMKDVRQFCHTSKCNNSVPKYIGTPEFNCYIKNKNKFQNPISTGEQQNRQNLGLC